MSPSPSVNPTNGREIDRGHGHRQISLLSTPRTITCCNNPGASRRATLGNTPEFREALAKHTKTDDIDALVIAQLLRTGEYVQSQVAEELILSGQLTKQTFLTAKSLSQAKPKQIEHYNPSRTKTPSLTTIFPSIWTVEESIRVSKWISLLIVPPIPSLRPNAI